MIAQLTGVIVRAESGSIVLDVHGVGYLLYIPASTLAAVSASQGSITLATHLVVREDELTLYGFASIPELKAFKMLLGVNGVGPRVALALLSSLSVPEMARALGSSDTQTISKVPGIGPKLAQRLCMEMGDKITVFLTEQQVEQAEAAQNRTREENAACEDALEALVQLGYSRSEARRAIERAFAQATKKNNPSSLIQAAFVLLNGGNS